MILDTCEDLFDVGRGIGWWVPHSDLEIIREGPDYHGAGEREGAMLRAWLERGLLPRTWQV